MTILQGVQVSNHYVAHLKQIHCYVSIISQFKKKLKGWEGSIFLLSMLPVRELPFTEFSDRPAALDFGR